MTTDYEAFLEHQSKYMDNLLSVVRELEGKFETNTNQVNDIGRQYVEDIKAHLKEVDEKNVLRYDMYLKTTKMSAIATLMASGCGIDTAFQLVNEIEERMK